MALTYLTIELILRDLVTETGSNQTGQPVSAATAECRYLCKQRK